MAEFGATREGMTTEENTQLVTLMDEINSGHYPTVALELLRRLNTQVKVRRNQEPLLVLFGRFLFGEKIAHFPEDVIAWRTERDYFSLVVDELNEVIARKNGRLADFRMRHRLDEESYKTEVERLARVISGLEDKRGTLMAEVETLESKLDFAQACALSYETQLRDMTTERDTAKGYVDQLRQDNSRVVEDRNDWRRAKQESDDIIKQIASLVPKQENEDIFDCLERVVSERISAISRFDQLNREVIEFLRSFGSWKDTGGVRHCNGEHIGHGLCETIDAQSRHE